MGGLTKRPVFGVAQFAGFVKSARIAQLVEQRIRNAQVVRSNRIPGSSFKQYAPFSFCPSSSERHVEMGALVLGPQSGARRMCRSSPSWVMRAIGGRVVPRYRGESAWRCSKAVFDRARPF